MFRHPIKEVNAEFIAEEKYLDSIQRTVRESCVAAGLSKKDIASVMLAIEEGATNIIRHAYLYEKGTIRLRIVIYRKLIIFSLIDFGRSFEPESQGAVDLQKLVESGRKGGLGFYMIQKIMDSVEYISTSAFNELRMIKRTHATAAEKTPGVPFLRRMFSLRVKFSFWTFLIMLIIIGASIYYFDYQTSEQMYQHKNETVRALTKTIADQAAGYYINRRTDVEFDELIVSYRRANPELRLIVLTDADNIIRAHSDDIRNIRKPYEPPPGIDTAELVYPQTVRSGRERLNHLVMPIMAGDRSLGTVHVTYSTETIYKKLTEARKRIVVLTVVLVLIGILGIYLLSNYFVSPIVKITNRIRRFTSGDLETEIPLEGAEEFFEISKGFNQMMTRLSQDRKNIIEREKMAKEIEVASEIQKTLLPVDLPHIPCLELDAFYKPASIVGGDLYDVFEISKDKYCLTVADVSGKGVPASLVMSMLRTTIKIYASNEDTAKGVLSKVYEHLRSNIPSGMFITVFLVVYDVRGHTINFVSAGHNPMLYYEAASGEVRQWNPRGMPLGVPVSNGVGFIDRLEDFNRKMGDGDSFFIYTDGISEAQDREGNNFGVARLVKLYSEFMQDSSGLPISDFRESIIERLDDFTGFVKPNDDITFIVARYISENRVTSDLAAQKVATRNLAE